MNKNYILGAFVGLLAITITQPVFAKTANVSVIYPLSGVSIEVGVPQTIKWTSSDYPDGAGVNINLMRQVSTNPNKFEFIKTIKKDTPNDGQEVWNPVNGDKGSNLIIQVSCSSSFVFPDGCLSSNGNAQLSVIDKAKKQSYTASILSAIGGLFKKIFGLNN